MLQEYEINFWLTKCHSLKYRHMCVDRPYFLFINGGELDLFQHRDGLLINFIDQLFLSLQNGLASKQNPKKLI